MPQFTQANRPIQLTTPLGKDVLLAVGLHGSESLSTLYQFSIDCLAELASVDKIKFDQMMGEPISLALELAGNKKRYFSGICQRISQSESGSEFTRYQLQMVPSFWLLTKRVQSRIFQHKNIPDILKDVLKGLKVEFHLQGTFEPRDFCVQYRESDFNFASRLMEEEGIFYYFKHEAGGETLLIGNTPGGHKELEHKSAITFKNPQQNRAQGEEFIESLIKSQEIIAGKITLWDHCFELPHKHLEAEKKTEKSVNLGKVSTSLAPAKVSASLENYDWPGAYAQRFDGINKGGGEQPADIQKIFTDNVRTTAIRAEQEAVTALSVQGLSDCRQMMSGYHFTVSSLSSDKSVKPFGADGQYLLTQVTHTIESDLNFRSGSGDGFQYRNSFTCIPYAIPYRPQHVTPIPVVFGSQTAVVVGPAGEEIFTDKYGRVKVQFHWDRQGKNDADSSCWIRVGTMWAGRQWGMVHIPRIGQEVIVDFLEGDPDQPIIVGNVFNADQMPHYKLPDEKTKSYLKSNTSPGGEGFNEIRLEDKKGKEQIFIHAERNKDIRVKNDRFDITKNNQHWIVGTGSEGEDQKKGNLYEQVLVDKHVTIRQHQQEHIGGNYHLMVGHGESGVTGGNMDVVIAKDHKMLTEGDQHLHVKGDRKTLIDKDEHLHVKGGQYTQVEKDCNLKVTGTLLTQMKDHMIKNAGGSWETVTNSKVVNASQNLLMDAGQKVFLGSGTETHIKAGAKLILEAGSQISLVVGGNFVDVSAAGVAINGSMVLINSGGAAGSGSGSKGVNAEDAKQAIDPIDAKKATPTKPTAADNAKTGRKSCN